MSVADKQVLMSIKPQFAIPLINGTKKIELRRRFPTDLMVDTKVLIYASRPISKVIGECRIKSVLEMPIKELWNYSCIDAMIPFDLFREYFKGCKVGYAINMHHNLKYISPKHLDSFLGNNSRPPQSYMYLGGEAST